MIIDTSNALAAPGSSRGYACLSVACRSIAPGVRLRPPRGARLGVPSQGPAGPYVPPSADPAAPALLFRPAPPPRSPVTACGCRGKGARLAQLGGGGAAAREREKGREGAGSGRVPVAVVVVVVVARVPSSGAPSRRTRFRGLGCVRSFVGPGRVEGPRAVVGRRWARVVCVGGDGVWEEGGGGAEAGSAFRSPGFAVRPRWRPGVRPTAAPRGPPPFRLPPGAPLLAPLPVPAARTRVRLGPEARPAARTVALAAALPGLRAPDGDPRDAAWSSARRAPASGSRPRRAAWGPALGFRVGAGWCRRVPVPVPRVAGRGVVWRGVAWRPPRPRFVLLPPVAPLRRGGRGAVGRGSLSRASPRRARLLPSETRPQIRRGDPLNLSILVSGGKETNQDSLSNGE